MKFYRCETCGNIITKVNDGKVPVVCCGTPMKELVPVYRRYAEFGGKYITLGSDAHSAERIGMNFARARDFAEALHLQPVTFCERKMVEI